MARNLVFVLAILFCSVALAARAQEIPDENRAYGAESKDKLLTALQEAIKQKDKRAFLRLTHWPSLSERLKNHLEMSTPATFSYSSPVIRFVELAAKEEEPFDILGEVYEWNVSPLGKLVVSDADSKQEVGMVFGSKDGRYYLASRIKRKQSK